MSRPRTTPTTSLFDVGQFIDRMDQIRAELGDVAETLPVKEARDALREAKASIAMAEDLVEEAQG